jgi:sn-glycerol 3-phosphate transport system substrate-binding protein
MKYASIFWGKACLCASFCFSTQIDLYHGFQGYLEEQFIEIVHGFERETGHQIELKAFNDYNALISEALEKKPHLFFGYEVAAASLIGHRDLVPVHKLGKSPGLYVEAIAAFYSSPEGELWAMPFNSSAGVCYYNKSAFRAAGLDPDHPPTTWPEFEEALTQLQRADRGGFTTAWPAAYHIEHVAALHGIPLATHANGFKGPARFTLMHPLLEFHLARVQKWRERGLFTYGGNSNDVEKLFTSGTCSILFQGANCFGLLKRDAHFEIGVAALPYWPQFVQKPFTLNAGGAAIWALKGHESDSQVVLSFLNYLSRPEVDRRWHKRTGYLPVTRRVAKEALECLSPAAKHAVSQVYGRTTTPFSVGLRVEGYALMREELVRNLEQLFDGKLTPSGALSKTQAFAESSLPKSKLK